MRPDPLRPRLVLDTHVVLDWLYFGDPRAGALDEAIRLEKVRWLATPAIRTELLHVLERDIGGRGQPALNATLSGWQRWVELTDPTEPAPPRALRCSDPSDQKFLDLAWRLRPAVLISADRALLDVRRRAAAEGVSILRLDDWLPPAPT